jgi:hypothetical protein
MLRVEVREARPRVAEVRVRAEAESMSYRAKKRGGKEVEEQGSVPTGGPKAGMGRPPATAADPGPRQANNSDH